MADVGTSGSYKESDVHRSMLEYIGISDKNLIESCINLMFDYFTELNYGTSTPLSIHDKKIRVKLAKKEQITEDTANRSYV